jgi:hypothetical protein
MPYLTAASSIGRPMVEALLSRLRRSVRARRMMENQPHACGVDDIACPFTPSKNTPPAWMMTLCIPSLFPIPLSARVISAERYWVTFATRPRDGRPPKEI